MMEKKGFQNFYPNFDSNLKLRALIRMAQLQNLCAQNLNCKSNYLKRMRFHLEASCANSNTGIEV